MGNLIDKHYEDDDTIRKLELQKLITEHTSATTTEVVEMSVSDIPRLAEEIHKLYNPVELKFKGDSEYEYELSGKRSYSFDYIGEVHTNAEGHRVGSLHTEYITAYDEDHAIGIFEKRHPNVDYDKPH